MAALDYNESRVSLNHLFLLEIKWKDDRDSQKNYPKGDLMCYGR